MNAQDTRVPAGFTQQLEEALAGNPELEARFAEHSFDPAGAAELADLDALPVQSKDELVFGGFSAIGWGEAARVFASPGPIYEAQPPGADPWRWGEALRAAGLEPGDVVANCFGYHLSPAGAMFDEAISAAGATVLLASHELDRAAGVAHRRVSLAGGTSLDPASEGRREPAPASGEVTVA